MHLSHTKIVLEMYFKQMGNKVAFFILIHVLPDLSIYHLVPNPTKFVFSFRLYSLESDV